VFDAARTHDADLLVMGRGPHGAPGRAESALDELTADLPCDTVVFQNRGFDPDHVVLPTAGGPDSDLGADVVRLLQDEFGSQVTILHVADDAEAGRAFVEQWAADHGLDDAACRVETGDVEAAIERGTRDATLIVMGASARGLLERLVSGSVVGDVAEDVDCSVILAERAGPRSFWERILGR
jgi:nucleotide-binding universal stress UspA family protein